ncbi:c-type cytochrome [Pseudoduganella namucuonensis]|uniref:Glucose/arabinose dehydrogenase, beta-propeller fold n=1 Tax=Pseudoduganella namucuonensis TaxID=1035707 RepID=A0A1I7JPK4_9BURK|nr:c-type cytochrome [Pseudoduganella namucuonensis]SFU87056.1 Glucose/arabinose dehydrogenase, beta-propeller fold [Pseudoduganella namucuonensis]
MNKSVRHAMLGVLALAPLISHAAVVTAGEKLYQAHCAACHGAKLEGAAGPSLADQTWIHGAPTKANLIKIIGKGVVDKGMPAWSPTLSAGQIASLADYIAPGARAAAPAAAAAPAKAAEAAPAKPQATLDGFKLPKGFRISVFAEGVETARSMAVSDSGVVYVGSRKAGKVYALVDQNKDGVADKVVTIAEGLQNPIGVTLLNGALYVAEISRIIRFDNIDASYAAKPAYKVVKADLPKETWHGEKYIKTGPDGKIYVPIGAPCNTCNKEDEAYSKIWRMNADGGNWEEYARGIRNTVGFAWHPVTKEMWFTDNGPDMMGDNSPSCELNVAPKAGLHFGFPYCHGGVLPDPEFGKGRACEQYVAPVAKLGPHVAPLGLAFYTGTRFPQQYRNNLFVAEHGSWNRENKIGYKVSLVTLYDSKVVSTTTFIDGFLRGADDVAGRPVDIATLADGSLLVSDDFGGRVYRVTYEGKPEAK